MGKYVALCDIRSDKVMSGYVTCHVTLGHMKVWESSTQTSRIVYKVDRPNK